MRSYKIFLSGAMGGLPYEEYHAWRKNIQSTLLYIYDNEITVFDPSEHFNFEENKHASEREIMNYDLFNVRNSNLVIVNLKNHMSLGTMAELTVAHENRIPIIGLNQDNEIVHPWQECMCERIFDNIEDLLLYIEDFYLI